MDLQQTANRKQRKLYWMLARTKAKFILYGGAAGGGKTWAGCAWIIEQCMKYPGSRWLIGRRQLKQLQLTTLRTFFKVAAARNLTPGKDFKYLQSLNIIIFPKNKSEVILAELSYKPSDPDYTGLGSLELSGAFIDEAGEVDFKAFDALKARVGRQHGVFKTCQVLKTWQVSRDDATIKPKILLCCNPAKNWLYKMIYKPWKEANLPADFEFIPALYSDNPYLHKEYIESLESISDPIRRARLLEGDWEYTVEANQLFYYDKIMDMFTNEFLRSRQSRTRNPLPEGNGNGFTDPQYITIDAARMGSDRAVIVLWQEFCAMEFHVFDKSRTTDIADKVRQIANQHHIPMSDVVCDSDGVGGGVADLLQCREFYNGATPMDYKGEKENYENLKTQCYYRFANRVNASRIYIKDRTYEAELIEELEASRRDKLDKDGKLAMLKKDDIKRNIGRSPDFADALVMREYFELLPRGIRIHVVQ